MKLSTSHFAVTKNSVLHFNILWKTCSLGKTLLHDDGSGDKFGHDSFVHQFPSPPFPKLNVSKHNLCNPQIYKLFGNWKLEQNNIGEKSWTMVKVRDAFTFRNNGCAVVHVFERRFGFRVYDVARKVFKSTFCSWIYFITCSQKVLQSSAGVVTSLLQGEGVVRVTITFLFFFQDFSCQYELKNFF